MIPSRRPATPGSISKQPYSTNKIIQEQNRHVEIQLWLTALVEGERRRYRKLNGKRQQKRKVDLVIFNISSGIWTWSREIEDA